MSWSDCEDAHADLALRCLHISNATFLHDVTICFADHYENKPIQIYWKFYHQKMKIFDKYSDIFMFLLKT